VRISRTPLYRKKSSIPSPLSPEILTEPQSRCDLREKPQAIWRTSVVSSYAVIVASLNQGAHAIATRALVATDRSYALEARSHVRFPFSTP